jgi:superfamily II DNA/RNA helicase
VSEEFLDGLHRLRDKRQKILDDPEACRQELIAKRLPDDYDDQEDDEKQRIQEELEAVVASIDPAALRDEIHRLTKLIDQARLLDQREIESKLTQLKDVLTRHGIFQDPLTKLLVFTEHKDTLDYLVAKLTGWGLTVTQIHGGMKIGGSEEPGTRLYAEKDFRDRAQVLVATEATGEGNATPLTRTTRVTSRPRVALPDTPQGINRVARRLAPGRRTCAWKLGAGGYDQRGHRSCF